MPFLIPVPNLCTLLNWMFRFLCLNSPFFTSSTCVLCFMLSFVDCFNLSCVYQDALTDLTGDSERLPLEEQHGTWLGHKVTFSKTLTYNTLSILVCTVSYEIFPPNTSLFSIAHFQQVG